MLIKQSVRQLAILAALAVGALPSLTAGRAEAALVFTVERQSAHTARVSVSGDLALATVFISLNGATSTKGDTGTDGALTGISIGGVTSGFYYTRYLQSNFVISGASIFPAGSASGSILATINETWAGIGTGGKVFSGEDGNGVEIGSYRIIAPVPVPAALPLLASGIVGLGWLRRRQCRAA